MPPKPAAKTGKGKPGTESGVSIQGYCDVIKGTPVVNDSTGKTIKRQEAALHVWSHTNQGEAEREEVFKSGCAPNIISFVDRGELEDRCAFMGCISAMALSEKHINEIVNNKVISAAVAMLSGDHARSKLPASVLLCHLAQRAEYSSRVADIALIPLAGVLMDAGPGWAQALQLQVHVAATIKALIENVQGELSDLKQARRMILLNTGIVPRLVQLIGYTPRMPRPAVVPAPPPIISAKGKVAKSIKPGGKKGAAEGAYPRGRKDAIATAAAACLRFMASCPGFVDQLIESGSLQILIDALLSSNDAQAAYISGMFWEICSEQDVAKAAIQCGAVPALLHICSCNLGSAIIKRPPKKDKKEDTPAARRDKKDDAPPPVNLACMAVCNAAGALHHLTFIDEAKAQVGRVNGLPILVACLRTGDSQTYENATGALWNVGLDVNNATAMQACAAPDFLSHPLPESWLMSQAEQEEGEEEEEEVGVPRVFLTNVPR